MSRALFATLASLLSIAVVADEPATRPAATQSIVQAVDGSVLLHARDVTIHGKTVRYEPKPQKNTVGFWTVKDDWISWDFTVNRGGRFRVTALQGCGKGSGGADVAFTFKETGPAAKDQVVTLCVQETGGFQNFLARDLGVVTLDRGPVTLSVVPVTKPGLAVMDLRQVSLTPETPTTQPTTREAGWELPAAIQRLAFSPDGAAIAVAYEKSTIEVFDVAGHASLAKLATGRELSNDLAFSDDGQLLFTYGVNRLFMATGGVDAWRWRTGERVAQLHSEKWRQLQGACMSPSGKTAWVWGGNATGVSAIDLATGAVTEFQPPQSPTTPFLVGFQVFSQTRAALLTAGLSGPVASPAQLTIVSPADFKTVETFPVANARVALSVLPDGHVLVLLLDHERVVARDLSAKRELFIINESSERVRDFQFAADASRVVIQTDRSVRVFDVGQGRQVAEWTLGEGRVDAVAVTRDGRVVAIGSGRRVTLHTID